MGVPSANSSAGQPSSATHESPDLPLCLGSWHACLKSVHVWQHSASSREVSNPAATCCRQSGSRTSTIESIEEAAAGWGRGGSTWQWEGRRCSSARQGAVVASSSSLMRECRSDAELSRRGLKRLRLTVSRLYLVPTKDQGPGAGRGGQRTVN